MLGKFPRVFAGASLFRSPPKICPQIAQRKDCVDEDYSAMDLCFLGCLPDAAPLLRIVVVESVLKLLGPSVKSLKILAARRPAIHNPTVVHLSQKPLHFCHHPSTAFCQVVPQLSSAKGALRAEFTHQF